MENDFYPTNIVCSLKSFSWLNLTHKYAGNDYFLLILTSLLTFELTSLLGCRCHFLSEACYLQIYRANREASRQVYGYGSYCAHPDTPPRFYVRLIMMDSLRLLTLRHKDDVDTYYRRYFLIIMLKSEEILPVKSYEKVSF